MHADLNKQDTEGKTPLHYAVETGQIGLVKCLMKAGADTSISDKRGRTPFSIAMKRRFTKIADLLLEKNLSNYNSF